jgi:hypothetical protein
MCTSPPIIAHADHATCSRPGQPPLPPTVHAFRGSASALIFVGDLHLLKWRRWKHRGFNEAQHAT